MDTLEGYLTSILCYCDFDVVCAVVVRDFGNGCDDWKNERPESKAATQVEAAVQRRWLTADSEEKRQQSWTPLGATTIQGISTDPGRGICLQLKEIGRAHV